MRERLELQNGDHASDDLAIEVHYVLSTEKLYPSESLGPSENPHGDLVQPSSDHYYFRIFHKLHTSIDPLLRLDMSLPDVTLRIPLILIETIENPNLVDTPVGTH